MKKRHLSQIPFSDSPGQIQGIVTENSLLRALHHVITHSHETIESQINSSIKLIRQNDLVEKSFHLISQGKIPIITSDQIRNDIVAVLTKIDLLTYIGSRT
jgi:CBS-domain-containing membrane protein